jgi:hypothetical protein
MTSAWTDQALSLLLSASVGGAWRYASGSTPAPEPTALAGLALLARSPSDQKTARAAGSWLASRQRKDGSVGASSEADSPGWPTAYAVLLWRDDPAATAATDRAVRWLLGERGTAQARDPSSPVGHDTTLVGWSWTAATHSWVEPTALSILALVRAGQGGSARVAEGVKLLRDRALPSGGWNYGNTIVLGAALRAHVLPTGLACLALAAAGGAGTAQASAGCTFLERELPRVRAPASLCYGLLGLAAWGRRPASSDAWLAESWDRARRRLTAAASAAHVLLAAGPKALPLLGIAARTAP